MAKSTIKCHWCKNPVSVSEVYVHEYNSKTGKPIKNKGHKECFEQLQERKQRAIKNGEGYKLLTELLLKLFNIPSLTGIMHTHIISWYHKGYDYDVIHLAVKLSEKAIMNNRDKPWIYHSVIIQNQLPNAIRQKQKEEKALKQNEALEMEMVEVIKVNVNSSRKNNEINEKFDIGKL